MTAVAPSPAAPVLTCPTSWITTAEDLIEVRALLEDDMKKVRNKSGAAAAVVARCRNDHIEPPAPGGSGR